MSDEAKEKLLATEWTEEKWNALSDPDREAAIRERVERGHGIGAKAQADLKWLLAELAACRELLIEADAYISHMVYRGSWPGDRYEIERLIGRLREASKGQA